MSSLKKAPIHNEAFVLKALFEFVKTYPGKIKIREIFFSNLPLLFCMLGMMLIFTAIDPYLFGRWHNDIVMAGIFIFSISTLARLTFLTPEVRDTFVRMNARATLVTTLIHALRKANLQTLLHCHNIFKGYYDDIYRISINWRKIAWIGSVIVSIGTIVSEISSLISKTSPIPAQSLLAFPKDSLYNILFSLTGLVLLISTIIVLMSIEMIARAIIGPAYQKAIQILEEVITAKKKHQEPSTSS